MLAAVLIGLGLAAAFWLHWREAVPVSPPPAPQAPAPMFRLFGFTPRPGEDPVTCLRDPDLIIAAAAIAYCELGGDPQPRDADGLGRILLARLDLRPENLAPVLALGHWLIEDSGDAHIAFIRLCKQLNRTDASAFGRLRPLLWDVGDLRVGPSGEQCAALRETDRIEALGKIALAVGRR